MKKETDSLMGTDNKKKLNDFMKAEKKKETLEAKAKRKIDKEKKKAEKRSEAMR